MDMKTSPEKYRFEVASHLTPVSNRPVWRVLLRNLVSMRAVAVAQCSTQANADTLVAILNDCPDENGEDLVRAHLEERRRELLQA